MWKYVTWLCDGIFWSWSTCVFTPSTILYLWLDSRKIFYTGIVIPSDFVELFKIVFRFYDKTPIATWYRKLWLFIFFVTVNVKTSFMRQIFRFYHPRFLNANVLPFYAEYGISNIPDLQTTERMNFLSSIFRERRINEVLQ